MPPHRQYDHAITLELGAPPVNARPYSYSPLQKDEIERQVNVGFRSDYANHEPLCITGAACSEERQHLALLCGLPLP